MERHSNPSSPPSRTKPTIYVQAEVHAFRELVQRLTGAAPASGSSTTSPSHSAVAPRRSPLEHQHPRDPSVRNLEIHPAVPSHLSPRSSPSISSPVTPLNSDRFFSQPEDPEERAIAEKRFYLHPSPSRGDSPELLPLFPLSSPACGAEIEKDRS